MTTMQLDRINQNVATTNFSFTQEFIMEINEHISLI